MFCANAHQYSEARVWSSMGVRGVNVFTTEAVERIRAGEGWIGYKYLMPKTGL